MKNELVRIRYALKNQNLRVRTIKDGYGTAKYLVIDESNMIQNGDTGMYLAELAEYAGIEL